MTNGWNGQTPSVAWGGLKDPDQGTEDSEWSELTASIVHPVRFHLPSSVAATQSHLETVRKWVSRAEQAKEWRPDLVTTEEKGLSLYYHSAPQARFDRRETQPVIPLTNEFYDMKTVKKIKY